MTKAEASTKIGLYCPFTKYPELDATAQAELALMARRDVSGSSSIPEDSSAAYADESSLAKAVAAGWRMKAGIAASDITFQSADQTFKLEQITKNCTAQAEAWEAKASSGAGRMFVKKLNAPDLTLLR